jgi:DNA (cytosine-5)-methyltransferase 1
MSLGFQEAGFFIAAGLDDDERCVETFGGNFAAKARKLDLREFRTDEAIRSLVHKELGVPRVDVIIGGPPCQGFTTIGQVKINRDPYLDEHQRRVLLERNHLYAQFVRFVAALKPQCFVMENVPHLASFQNGKVSEKIRSDFDELEYEVGTIDDPYIDGCGIGQPLFLDAKDFGVPQTRKRLFYLGFRRGFAAPVAPPRPTHQGRVEPRTGAGSRPEQLSMGGRMARDRLRDAWLPLPRTLADAIADLPPLVAPALEHVVRYCPQFRPDLQTRGAFRDPDYPDLMRMGMATDEALLFDHVVRPVRQDDAEAFLHIPEGGTYHDVPPEYRRYKLERDHFEDKYCRLPWGQPCRALTAHIAKDGYWYIHPDIAQGRTFSVREAARVQSFPDWFRFAGHRTTMYRQIGNAVPPLLARALAERILEAVKRGTTTPVGTRASAPKRRSAGKGENLNSIQMDLIGTR